MEEPIPEPVTSQTLDKPEPTSALVDDKKSSSLNGEPSGPSDVESKAHPDDERTPNPPMTWRRFMAIFSLGCLLAAAQIPIYLIGGALRELTFYLFADSRVYGRRYWWLNFLCLACYCKHPCLGCCCSICGIHL